MISLTNIIKGVLVILELVILRNIVIFYDINK